MNETVKILVEQDICPKCFNKIPENNFDTGCDFCSQPKAKDDFTEVLK